MSKENLQIFVIAHVNSNDNKLHNDPHGTLVKNADLILRLTGVGKHLQVIKSRIMHLPATTTMFGTFVVI